MGAPVLLDLPMEMIDPVNIATYEFDQGSIPITVRRS
jgi:DNA-directed RNA polymerase subunit K